MSYTSHSNKTEYFFRILLIYTTTLISIPCTIINYFFSAEAGPELLAGLVRGAGDDVSLRLIFNVLITRSSYISALTNALIWRDWLNHLSVP